MKHLSARITALLCVVSCVTVAAVEVWPAGRDVRTVDQNGDGRADIWRSYDTRGQLTEVEVDTNFDGSPDIAEYYQRGVLVRRESDRNFNGQTDLVEEFDPDTHGRTRSLVDIDYDGTADLLVLFRDERPAFTTQIHALRERPNIQARDRTAAYPRSADHMAALIDPSESETSVRGIRVAGNDDGCVGLFSSGGLPHARFTTLSRLSPSAEVLALDVRLDAPSPAVLRSSRAPPVS